MNRMIGRQGDVFVVLANNTGTVSGKQRAPRGGRLILVEGEATGHHHSLDANTAVLTEATAEMIDIANQDLEDLFDDNVQLTLIGLMETTAETLLEHQQHPEIEIAPGCHFWILAQREYTPERIQRTID